MPNPVRFRVGMGRQGSTKAVGARSGKNRAPTYATALEADPQRELDLAGGIYRACTFAKSPA